MIGINPDFDYLFDPQQRRPVCFCKVCGGEIYGDGRCLRCERRAEQEDDSKYEGSKGSEDTGS